jgi:tRNA-2-methylthio-N6-dimethylallyladenosine synthase
MNARDSEKLSGILLKVGFDLDCDESDADLVIYNTCTVRDNANQKVYGHLGTLKARKKKQPNLKIVLCGCMMQEQSVIETISKDYKFVDLVFGTHNIFKFAELLYNMYEAGSQIIDIWESTDDYVEDLPVNPKYTYKSGVNIMYGCNNFCTYCIVPYVRGREVSRNPDDIMKELDMLSERGVKEVTLLGQNVNSYMWKNTDKSDVAGEENSSAIDFPELMQRIADHLRETSSSIGWVRFMSSHPKDISERLIDVIAKESVMCRHIHLPVQHGSTRILQLMNRKYTREDYLAKVRMIRSKLPGVSLTTDIMLGFPGETDEDFEQAVSLLQEVKYEAAFMYYYNPREGTKACSMPDQIPMEVKKNRLAKVIDIQLAINRAEMSKRVGTTTKVLVECVSKDNENELLGRTEQDEHVVFAADKSLIGSFVDVKLIELTGNTFKGTL